MPDTGCRIPDARYRMPDDKKLDRISYYWLHLVQNLMELIMNKMRIHPSITPMQYDMVTNPEKLHSRMKGMSQSAFVRQALDCFIEKVQSEEIALEKRKLIREKKR